MFLLGGGFSLLMAVLLCVHVVRTNQQMYWLFIILLLQPLGGFVYLVAIVLPELFGGTRAQRFGQAARDTLDPTREYRRAREAVDETPTVHNQIRLGHAASALGKHAEAEALFAQAAQGVHADDPTLLLGRANALLELGRAAEALPLLERLVEEQDRTRSPPTALAFGRAFEALGRMREADTAYQFAAGRLPGLEGVGRYAAFLARAGRRAEAQEMLAEIDRRLARSNPQFRREGRVWRDLAARAMTGA